MGDVKMNPAIARCEREIAEIRAWPGEHPAWLCAMGEADWWVEKIMIEQGNYETFLVNKSLTAKPCGFDPSGSINEKLFDFQRDIVRWSLRRGKAAVWAGTGLGKTAMQLEWARHVAAHSGGNVLVLCPLAVAEQTEKEARKFGMDAPRVSRDGKVSSVTITNYEMMHKFKPVDFAAVVLDESSILKSFDGATRKAITEFCVGIPYRLSCSATPAPNDYVELGTQCEFLGVMSRTEMLATFFIHDGGDTSIWRLKKHAVEKFWEWVASWAVLITKPSDLGYADGAFQLPPITYHPHVVPAPEPENFLLAAAEAKTLTERRQARRDSLTDRCALAAKIANESREQWLIWCDLNDESDLLTKSVTGAVEVAGKHSDEQKIERMAGFANGKYRVLVTKPSIAGWGMNWQHCANMAFVGLSDSFEAMYQATRRCWRFGQQREVNVHVITSELEGAVVRNIQRKEEQYLEMVEGMLVHMKDMNTAEVHFAKKEEDTYEIGEKSGDAWVAKLGDSCEALKSVASESVHYVIYSPPFASLYTYSNSSRDLGNSRTKAEFFAHYEFIVAELFRVLKPGRLVSFHCMNLPKSKERDGVIGIDDFRGDLIRIHERAGFVMHSEVVIWKDPVTAMQRTKALGLLHKQVKKDSCRSRQGIPDYLVTMMKVGENQEPVSGRFEEFIGDDAPPRVADPEANSINIWQRYASPVWMDINPSDTLQRKSAREEEDERHICPLQLQVIERALELWTNESDLVLSPFMGIGSEGYVALRAGRRFWGCELKRSYWEQACRNLDAAVRSKQCGLFENEDEHDID